MKILTIMVIIISMFLVSCAPPKTGRAADYSPSEEPAGTSEEPAGTSEEPEASLEVPEASATPTPSASPKCDNWDCSKKDNWYEIGRRVVKVDDCKDQELIKQEYHDYYCDEYEQCVKEVTDTREVPARGYINVKPDDTWLIRAPFSMPMRCCGGEETSMDSDEHCGRCGRHCNLNRDGRNSCVAVHWPPMLEDEDFECHFCDDNENVVDCEEEGNVVGNTACCKEVGDEGCRLICEEQDNGYVCNYNSNPSNSFWLTAQKLIRDGLLDPENWFSVYAVWKSVGCDWDKVPSPSQVITPGVDVPEVR